MACRIKYQDDPVNKMKFTTYKDLYESPEQGNLYFREYYGESVKNLNNVGVGVCHWRDSIDEFLILDIKHDLYLVNETLHSKKFIDGNVSSLTSWFYVKTQTIYFIDDNFKILLIENIPTKAVIASHDTVYIFDIVIGDGNLTVIPNFLLTNKLVFKSEIKNSNFNKILILLKITYYTYRHLVVMNAKTKLLYN